MNSSKKANDLGYVVLRYEYLQKIAATMMIDV